MRTSASGDARLQDFCGVATRTHQPTFPLLLLHAKSIPLFNVILFTILQSLAVHADEMVIDTSATEHY